MGTYYGMGCYGDVRTLADALCFVSFVVLRVVLWAIYKLPEP
jgi:hypothetical protein